MPNTKLTISIVVFSLLLFCTSVIKNKTNIIEKNIVSYEKQIFTLEKELYESQLEFNYLTSIIHCFLNDLYSQLNKNKKKLIRLKSIILNISMTTSLIKYLTIKSLTKYIFKNNPKFNSKQLIHFNK